jgi:S-formylglutathione hydrolase FrmB
VHCAVKLFFLTTAKEECIIVLIKILWRMMIMELKEIKGSLFGYSKKSVCKYISELNELQGTELAAEKENAQKAATEYEKKGGKPMIVVCPDALTTFYYDSYQTKYKTYFFEELVPAIEKTYKVRTDKYSRAVAGLSMGGYGTLYYGLGEPDKFCYAYACSAAIEMQGLPSLTDLARKADPNQLPGITLEMGTEDWVTGDGKDFHNTLNSLGIKHEYIARSGVHDWKFWQECLPKILKRCGETFE